jgi:uncharacterized membrane protein
MTRVGDREVPLRVRRVLAIAAGALGICTIVGLIALWPSDDVTNRLLRDVVGRAETYDARVVRATREPCAGTAPEDEITCFTLAFELLGGPDEGSEASIGVTSDSPLSSIEPGTTIVVARNPQAPRDIQYSFVDIQRGSMLWVLALTFSIAVVLLGRLRGAAALIGLVGTFVLLLEFVLPAILSGTDPTLVAVVGASAIAYIALYLAHGFGAMTSIALLGTLASLILTIGLGSFFVGLAQFSGFSSEETFLVNLGVESLDLSGLILAGVIIGALGAIDDMTVTQASAVSELASANPNTTRRELFGSGLRIGRDHVSSTVNTLFLAYVGASLPLLLLFVLTDQSPLFVANREIVATEIVRALVGSIGLVASVPLTTWLAAYCFSFSRGTGKSPDTSQRQRTDRPATSDAADDDERDRDEMWIPERRRDVYRRRRSR